MSEAISVRLENQRNAVADEVSAIIAVIRPILEGVLYAIKGEVVSEVGGYENVKLRMLPRLYLPGDGDCGICFEYAVHDAIRRGEPAVMEKVVDSLCKHCRVPGAKTVSILFGAEKSGALKLIDTAEALLTDESRVLTGAQAQPVKLKRYVQKLAKAFRRPADRGSLPSSIGGLWKADLFLGNSDSDRWVGTTVKINPKQLEPAAGLRVGIVPSSWGRSDAVRFDEGNNIVVCPLPYDGAFMELFYSAWVIVKQFIAYDAYLPPGANLPQGAHRYVAKLLEDRRDFGVLEVVRGLAALAQPELLVSRQQEGALVTEAAGKIAVETIIAPISLQSKST